VPPQKDNNSTINDMKDSETYKISSNELKRTMKLKTLINACMNSRMIQTHI
jgi:hypothetical protein